MSKLNFKTSIGISTIISLSLILASCGGGSAASYSPGSTNKSITTTVLVSATPSIVAYNTATTITWSSTNSDTCTSSPIGIAGTSGRYPTPLLTTSTTYTITCTGPTGAASNSILIPVTGGSIVAASTACTQIPMRGNVYYYCDCGTGAEAGCVPGNDNNAGTDASAPKQTIGNAATRFGSLLNYDTVALCKGGAFNSAGEHNIGTFASGRCAVNGVADRACNDLREYTPPTSIFVGTAKPIINISAGNEKALFRFSERGGVRLLNLKLKGDVADSTSSNVGVFIAYGAQDVTMCNLDIDGFGLAVYSESDDGKSTPNVNTNNIKLTGSRISNSRNQGFLGSSDNMQINYNYWDRNGSFSVFTHALYFSSNNTSVSNMQVIGNHVYGQYGNTCKGVVVVGHVAVNGLRFESNTVEIDANAATGGCYGIGFGAANQAGGKFMRNSNFSNNTVINGGNEPLTVGECPNCIIENNLIIQNWDTVFPVNGISMGGDSLRTEDDVSNNVTIRNNTVWFGPLSNKGGIGIRVGVEKTVAQAAAVQGTGYTVINNTVTHAASTTTYDVFSCYSYALATSFYTSINNNHCHTPVSSRFDWEKGGGILETWLGSGFDINSITGNPLFTGDPLFTTPGTDFKPKAGSPLIKTGSTPAYIGAFAPN